MRCLILRLEGPLMSFGDTAIDEIRPTRLLPGRSLLAGLIGNALGFEHRDVNALQRLQERLLFAARLDQAGEDLLDYQTALIGKKDPIWITRGHYEPPRVCRRLVGLSLTLPERFPVVMRRSAVQPRPAADCRWARGAGGC
ncbi:MAG: type I-E CRISPR-associated protein Cas5/CasD [Geminicoccaceae bacterium]|nr:type I-E CRISPR-associated protein Cas5/CasD [Geminicoccaceae bacterium]